MGEVSEPLPTLSINKLFEDEARYYFWMRLDAFCGNWDFLPYSNRKLRGTLTLNVSKSIHISKYLILLSVLYSVATPKHFKPLSPENYVCVIALAPNLRAASFYNRREFFHYSSTIKLLSLLIFIKGSHSILKALLPS